MTAPARRPRWPNSPRRRAQVPRHLVQAQQRHPHCRRRHHLERPHPNWRNSSRLQSGSVPVKNIGRSNNSRSRPCSRRSSRLAAIGDLRRQRRPPKPTPAKSPSKLQHHPGGNFTSRINMNLRENKHWSYGAFTFLLPAAASARSSLCPVQTDKTKSPSWKWTGIAGHPGQQPPRR